MKRFQQGQQVLAHKREHQYDLAEIIEIVPPLAMPSVSVDIIRNSQDSAAISCGVDGRNSRPQYTYVVQRHGSLQIKEWLDKRWLLPANGKASRLIALCGGPKMLAKAIGVDVAVVSRWTSHGPRGSKENVPPKYNTAIMDAARKMKLPPRLISECLEMVCPCCKRPVKTGRIRLAG